MPFSPARPGTPRGRRSLNACVPPFVRGARCRRASRRDDVNGATGQPAGTPRPYLDKEHTCLIIWSSAPDLPARSWPSGWRLTQDERCSSSTSACTLVETRYDEYDAPGILIHTYGPHIFHTNSREVFDYLSRFTEWRPYQHRVRAWVDGQLLPIPINLDTVNGLYGLKLTSFELEEFFASVAEPRTPARTSEDVIVGKVGRELYNKFFRNYTRKQWGLDPSELDADGDRACARPDQPRRSLLRGHVPGDAGPRLYPDVRAHALASKHQGHAEHGLSRDRARHSVRER